jgi:hypothetical protein
MESDGSTQDTRIYTGSGRALRVKPYSSGDGAAFVFVCSIIGVVALSYVVDWNERG